MRLALFLLATGGKNLPEDEFLAVVVGVAAVGEFAGVAEAPPGHAPAGEGARHFEHVEVVDDPMEALARAHEHGDTVLVTGSLYLLGDIAQRERRAAWRG